MDCFLKRHCFGHLFTVHMFYEAVDVNLGPVVQSIVSLTSSLVVIMLTVLVSAISGSQVKLLTFFQQKCYRIFHI